MEKIFGIDISKYQGDFDLEKATSEGIKFVIIRCGSGYNGRYIDPKFERNYNLAKSLNLPVGVYFYSYAVTNQQALEEAKFCYEKCLKGKTFELPVYYDIKEKSQFDLGKRNLTDIIKTFCDYIKDKNYVSGVYASLSHLRNYTFINEIENNYEIWIAQWNKTLDYQNCGMWQFGGETNLLRSPYLCGQIVDQDYMLKDYLSLKNKEDYTNAVYKVIQTAKEEIGYLEKSSNSQLDDKTANAGYNNYTKYARDLDKISGFYNGKKQGYAYCDVFVDWCFYKTFGAEIAKKMLYQPNYSAGAGCTYSMGYYKNADAFYKSPEIGDQIFFGSGNESTHTGIVVDISDSKVITIEGNTSGGSGVIANGGGVFQKTYPIKYGNILGYGRPNYSILVKEEKEYVQVPDNSYILTVKQIQKYLNKNYNSGLDEDNIFGKLTKAALIKAIQKNLKHEQTGIFSNYDKDSFGLLKKGDKGEKVKLMQFMLICKDYDLGTYGADGDFGNDTNSAVCNFQRNNNLVEDGIVGPLTSFRLFR